jgi:hypothetical protein
MPERQFDPTIDCLLRSTAPRAHSKNPRHRPLHEIPRANLRTLQIISRGSGIEANYQVVPIHPAAHIASDHESKPTEHRLFFHVGPTG